MERLLKENAALRASYDALLIRYARLEERLDELLAIARQNQRKETKPKPAEPAPVLEGAEKIAFEDRPRPPEKPAKPKEKKKSKRRKSRCIRTDLCGIPWNLWQLKRSLLKPFAQ